MQVPGARYTVVKQNERWGVCARGSHFLECDDYAEAVEIAKAAAKLLGETVEIVDGASPGCDVAAAKQVSQSPAKAGAAETAARGRRRKHRAAPLAPALAPEPDARAYFAGRPGITRLFFDVVRPDASVEYDYHGHWIRKYERGLELAKLVALELQAKGCAGRAEVRVRDPQGTWLFTVPVAAS